MPNLGRGSGAGRESYKSSAIGAGEDARGGSYGF